MMSFLPIVERELRVGARLPRTHRDRWLMGFIMLAISALVYYVNVATRSPGSQIGRNIFQFTSSALFFAALCYGFVTGDALSRERREGTLGLLFLTNLRAYDLVIGKLSVTSLSAIYALFGAFPILAIPLLMGGVSGANFWLTQLAILNTVFFALSAGLLVSSVTYGARNALVLTGVLIGLFTIGLPIFEEEFTSYRPSDERISTYLSPLFMFNFALYARGWTARFWMPFGTVHMLGWIFLLGTCLILPRNWKQSAPSARALRWQERLQRWSLGAAATRQKYRSRLLSQNPICWLDDRYRLQKSIMWALLLFCVVWWMWSWSTTRGSVVREQDIIPLALLLHYGLVIWIATQAAHRFADDRQTGALELLLVTPLTVGEIVEGRMLALRRQFVWPIRAIIAFDLLMMSALLFVGPSPWRSGNSGDFVVENLSLLMAGLIMLIANAWSVGWLCLWLGLASRSWGRAVMSTLLRVVLLHWLVFIFCMVVWISWLQMGGRFRSFGTLSILGTWFTLGLMLSVLQGTWARRQLHARFRELAVRSHDAPPPGWFRRLWKRLPFRSREAEA